MVYWEKAGKQNSEQVIELAVQRAQELGIKHLVVASSTGATAELCLHRGLQVACISQHAGYSKPGENRMAVEKRQLLTDAGAQVLTTTHLMAGLDRALRFKFGGVYPSEIIAHSLKMLGQGIKVCVEVAVMALDAGIIPYGEEVIAVAGSGGGADTAVVIVPAHSPHFFDTQVKEIICKPREIGKIGNPAK